MLAPAYFGLYEFVWTTFMVFFLLSFLILRSKSPSTLIVQNRVALILYKISSVVSTKESHTGFE